eukprot:scaffold154456_cov61-Attheya_sp.AAC.1
MHRFGYPVYTRRNPWRRQDFKLWNDAAVRSIWNEEARSRRYGCHKEGIWQQPSRCLSSSGSNNHDKQETSWGRSAKRIQNVATGITKGDKYAQQIREEDMVSTDPATHVKTLENEVQAVMGQALGRQAEKITHAKREMDTHWTKYQTLLLLLSNNNNEDDDNDNATTNNVPALNECAKLYNFHRERAKKARWELLVHRQAVGFVVDNHRVVHELFPIGDALPILDTASSKIAPDQQHGAPKPQRFGSQLDWWQQIGRWK